ncbi:MFS transporter [Acerihabitans sp. KWT182]|uniref:MFS transporter n=1 Tax=Acerihabitans sp. KWT182 TaxID=3157919 RepID=A0AAU7Q7U2_9GAMM
MGYYVTIPLFSIILMNTKNLDTISVGYIIAIFAFAAKGGSLPLFIFPSLSHNIKKIIMFGTLSASLGLILIFISNNFYIIIGGVIISGVGISINILGIQIYISGNIVEKKSKLKNFTLQIWIANLTAVVGPLITGFFFSFKYWVFALVIFIFLFWCLFKLIILF